MSIVWSICSYVAAFAIVELIAGAVTSLSFSALPLMRRFTFLQVPLGFAFSASGILLGVFAFVHLAAVTPLRAAYAMVLLIAVGQCANDTARVRAVRATHKPMHPVFQRTGVFEEAGRLDVAREEADRAGHLIGFAVSALLLPGDASFF